MDLLEHIVEPEGLLLLWQPADEAGSSRARRVVGEVLLAEHGGAVFRYRTDTTEFEAATAEGFRGFPAFDLKATSTREGVIEALVRRLPPRRRDDFDRYLAQHCLPSPFRASDIALLGYTGARLPSDGFSLVPVFPAATRSCDYVTEVAGTRHVFDGDISSLRLGNSVEFVAEPTNKFDADAVAIYAGIRKLGYVNRALRGTFNRWLFERTVTGRVCRLNGRPDRPLVYVRVEVR